MSIFDKDTKNYCYTLLGYDGDSRVGCAMKQCEREFALRLINALIKRNEEEKEKDEKEGRAEDVLSSKRRQVMITWEDARGGEEEEEEEEKEEEGVRGEKALKERNVAFFSAPRSIIGLLQ